MTSRLVGTGALFRLLGVAWCLVLIALMATGTVTTARIGAMTFGVQHDVRSAAIAISEINFGLKGKLGYHEVEVAIAKEVTGIDSVWALFRDDSLTDDRRIGRRSRAASKRGRR